MISGLPPFRAVNEYQILKKIGQLDYDFPNGFPELPRDLVCKLLVVNPENRLGHAQTGGIEALKKHPYFKVIITCKHFVAHDPLNLHHNSV